MIKLFIFTTKSKFNRPIKLINLDIFGKIYESDSGSSSDYNMYLNQALTMI